MTTDELLKYMDETARLARENQDRAMSLYDYIFPPWRWRKWWRIHREVERGIAETQRRRAVAHREAPKHGIVLP